MEDFTIKASRVRLVLRAIQHEIETLERQAQGRLHPEVYADFARQLTEVGDEMVHVLAQEDEELDRLVALNPPAGFGGGGS